MYLISSKAMPGKTYHYVWTEEQIAKFFKGLTLGGLGTEGIRIYLLNELETPVPVSVTYSKELDTAFFYNKYGVLTNTFKLTRAEADAV